jgi:hypothetical protein
LIVVDEGPGSPRGTGALFRATAVTPVNAEVQTIFTMEVPPRRPLIQIKDRHAPRQTKPECQPPVAEIKDIRAASQLSVALLALLSVALWQWRC